MHEVLFVKSFCCLTAAAEIAVDLMLQEDFGHPLCRLLSWRACHLRLTELLATPEVTEEPDAAPADDEEVFCLGLFTYLTHTHSG